MRQPLLSSVVLLASLGAACGSKTSGGTSSSAPVASGAAPVTPPSATFTGAVAETMNSGGYTYARLQRGAEDVWVAVPQFDARVGETISVALDMPMQNFQSRTLNRTFPLIYFAQEAARNGQPLAEAPRQPDAPALMSAHGTSPGAPVVTRLDPPPGGIAIADLYARKATLAGKTVTVRGTVVKFNGGILDRNWLHIQDGSGSPDARNNDLTITTDAAATVGDVVTMTGVVETDRDFGVGYTYDVMVEQAKRD